MYGAWHDGATGSPSTPGCAENVLDHRLNTRTVYMNPLSRFLYLNMNYHVEHHMFPMVPYHALPALHDEIKDDLPPPAPSIAAAFRELAPVLWRSGGSRDTTSTASWLPGSHRRRRGAQ